MNKDFVLSVSKIQTELNAPKGQYNSYGGYSYRSCEDILEALKPLLKREHLVVMINDDIVCIGERFYVKATATITDGVDSFSNTAFAREPLDRKGMDCSQITGATSSYARKYALNGLLCIDDNKDADTMDNREQPKAKAKVEKKVAPKEIAPKEVVKEQPKEQDITEAYGRTINFLNALEDNSFDSETDKKKYDFIMNLKSKLPADQKKNVEELLFRKLK